MLPRAVLLRKIHAGAVALVVAAAPAAFAETLMLEPGSDLVGALTTVRAAYEDTLTDIARRTGLGYEDMRHANPQVDPWLPGEDAEILLPTRYILPAGTRQGVLVNIAEFRLYHFTRVGDRPAVATFPVSIGRMDWATPIGMHKVLSKQAQPTWYPPASIRAEHAADGDILPRAIPPGPKNPLGDYAMRLTNTGYLIHGTNRSVGIGMQVTHGCIRMYPEDIEWLFPRVPVGTPVQIVNQPYKFGWAADGLYLEVHPHLEGDAGAGDHGMTDIMALYVRATEGRPAQVDWALVEEAYRASLGIPVRVGGPLQSASADDGAAAASTGAVRNPQAQHRMDAKYPRR